MALPDFNSEGDLPEGVYQSTFDEVVERFGQGTPQRQIVAERFKQIFKLAQTTGKLERLVIFGSFVTAKPDPNDIDIILVMRDDFGEQDFDADEFPVFDHLKSQQKLGASLFVIRPAFLIGETIDEFVAHWQVKRDLRKRGIIQLIFEESQ
ncbi:MAG: hypothetical protein AB1757_15865 [Acidobacteriota bacterium]